MIFTETPLKGAFVIEPEKLVDERGFFARSWCQKEFLDHGLNPKLVQCNISFNKYKNTLRGMHFQTNPHEEAKLIRCTQGAIYDVIIDLRPESATFKEWFGLELSSTNRRMLYVPESLAHGFLTIENATEVFYQMSEFFHLECARGVRWNDPAFNIMWPTSVLKISDRDNNYPNFIFPK